MPRIVRGALIQATLCEPGTSPIEKIKQAMIDKHVALIEQAAGRGAQVVCLQELFYGPYFCAEQDTRWYAMTERIPDGPTLSRGEIARVPARHPQRSASSKLRRRSSSPRSAVAGSAAIAARTRPRSTRSLLVVLHARSARQSSRSCSERRPILKSTYIVAVGRRIRADGPSRNTTTSRFQSGIRRM